MMPEIPASLAAFATRELHWRGIEIRTGTKLTAMDERSATLTTGEVIPTTHRVLDDRRAATGGGARAGPAARPARRADRGRRHHARQGLENVWAIGDAAVPDPARGRSGPCPPTAQHAFARARWWPTTWPPSSAAAERAAFATARSACSSTWGGKAVATMLGVRLRGFVAWFAARTYHMLMMPGYARRLSRGRLDGWTVLRPRVGRARTAAIRLRSAPISSARRRRAAAGERRALVPRGASERPASDVRARRALAARERAPQRHRGVRRRRSRPTCEEWSRQRPLLEFIAAQPEGQFFVCESGNEIVGYARVARFGQMDELSELAVSAEHAGRGIGRALLQRCWPEPPSPRLGGSS